MSAMTRVGNGCVALHADDSVLISSGLPDAEVVKAYRAGEHALRLMRKLQSLANHQIGAVYDNMDSLQAEITRLEVVHAGRAARRIHTARRRSEFDSIRSDLVLKMLDAGAPYVCAHPDCEIHELLTVDHVVPLSRGGTDDLNNLQFMCRTHNSRKGTKTIEEFMSREV